MLLNFSLFFLASALVAQTVEGPVFEVASLKTLGPDVHEFQGMIGGPGTATPTRASLRWGAAVLLREAFDAPSYRFANLNRVPDDFYEFAAVVPEKATRDEFRTMLRNLLIARFHLRYHQEKREIKGYELRVADGGPKLKLAAHDPPPPPGARHPTVGKDGYLVFPRGMSDRLSGNGPRFSVQRLDTTMNAFAREVIEEWFMLPVVNETGLTEKYDINLRWNAENSFPPLDGADSADFSELSFVPALLKQLGLILREGKVPVEMIVIDAMDRKAAPN